MSVDDGTSIAAVPDAQGDYVLNGVSAVEGLNTLALRAVDAAGNESGRAER